MNEWLFVAVENAIPADHPVAALAVPLGLLFFSGSVFALLWSNYGAKKAGAIYGVAFFGFCFLIGIFWWFGGPGISQNLGITHLPGQTSSEYTEQWYAFEPGSETASFYDITGDEGEFVSIEEFTGVDGLEPEEQQEDPLFADISGQVGTAVSAMNEQFLPVTDDGVPQIGGERREALEEEAAEAGPEEADGRVQPFYTAQEVGPAQVATDPDTGVLIARAEFQTLANYEDADEVPLDPVEVGEPTVWYAFFDPGAAWFPSSLWTGISLFGFLVSLFALDRLERRDKRRAAHVVEEPEDVAVPVRQ